MTGSSPTISAAPRSQLQWPQQPQPQLSHHGAGQCESKPGFPVASHATSSSSSPPVYSKPLLLSEMKQKPQLSHSDQKLSHAYPQGVSLHQRPLPSPGTPHPSPACPAPLAPLFDVQSHFKRPRRESNVGVSPVIAVLVVLGQEVHGRAIQKL